MKSVTHGVSRGWLLLVLAGCLSGAAAYANPANCDDDMTEDQRWTAKLCSAHPGCALVFGIQDSCVKAKSFLSRFGMAGSRRASSLTDDEVGDALVASGVPRSGLSSCLFSFDRAKCLEFLSGGPKPPSAREKADALAEQLNSGVYNTTRENSALGLNRQALRMCEEATSEKNTRDAVRAKERCGLAEKGVQNCMSRKQSHDELRAQLQSLIGDGSLGADAARYRTLSTTAYPECPTTLPGSGKTPQAALADYLKFWDTPAADDGAKGEVALPRRGGNSGGDRFRQAITQADQEERERPAREARERAERERIAAAEASLTPQQRLARSFDERISAARQQCAASESSCNTGCLGIAAVGLISAFSRNSAGASAATEQMQQCTNRCDQEKSVCDQQVAALEREKSQVLMGGAGGGAVQVSAENLNGEWKGESSGNQVRIQVESRGIFVTRITQNAGQSEAMLYNSNGQGRYRINFSGGGWSEVEVISPDKISVRISDGWSDVFQRISQQSSGTQPAGQVGSSGGRSQGQGNSGAAAVRSPCVSGSYPDGKGGCTSGTRGRGTVAR